MPAATLQRAPATRARVARARTRDRDAFPLRKTTICSILGLAPVTAAGGPGAADARPATPRARQQRRGGRSHGSAATASNSTGPPPRAMSVIVCSWPPSPSVP